MYYIKAILVCGVLMLSACALNSFINLHFSYGNGLSYWFAGSLYQYILSRLSKEN